MIAKWVNDVAKQYGENWEKWPHIGCGAKCAP